MREGPVARATVRVIGRGARDTLHLYSTQFDDGLVLFAQSGEVSNPPIESPVASGVYVIERDDHLWLLTDSGAVRLTADTVAGIARDTLRSQTIEGVRSLFWAASPAWSPDGSAIAYVTNRTWMLAPGGGQELWLAELRSRRERPLVSERGEFFSPDGWLGSELIFTESERGIFAVNPRSGRRRRVAVGAVAALSTRGTRLLYTTWGDTMRAHILAERGVVTIPDPPQGERLSHGGVFSPNGDRVVVETTFAADSGMTRALYLFEIGRRQLTRLQRWSFRENGRHPHGLPAWLDNSTLLLTQFDPVTGLESSTMIRLPSVR